MYCNDVCLLIKQISRKIQSLGVDRNLKWSDLFISGGPPYPDTVVLVVSKGDFRVVLQRDGAIPIAQQGYTIVVRVVEVGKNYSKTTINQ